MEYDNELSGILFKNDKEGVEARPDYTGKIQIEQVEYRLAAWIREGKNGKFMSMKASLPDPSYQKQEQAPETDNDPVPF